MVALGGEWRGEYEGKEGRKVNRARFYLAGLIPTFVHPCSCSNLHVNTLYLCLSPQNWRLYESEYYWGNRRSAEVMGLSGKQHVCIPTEENKVP